MCFDHLQIGSAKWLALIETAGRGTRRTRMQIERVTPARCRPLKRPAGSLHATAPSFNFFRVTPNIDVRSQGRLVDIVKEGFDAGVRLSGTIPRDMIAVQLGGQARCIAVASPRYLARHKRPQTPDDLRSHECIRIRLPNGKLFAWEFEKRGQGLAIDVQERSP